MYILFCKLFIEFAFFLLNTSSRKFSTYPNLKFSQYTNLKTPGLKNDKGFNTLYSQSIFNLI